MSTSLIFIDKAKLKHSEKYDYSLVKYVNSYTKVKIICPVHGSFDQRPDKHISGTGCFGCSVDKSKLTKEEFVKRANKIYDSKYNYSSVEYINNYTKVKIKCPVHGIYEKQPSFHLLGYGCIKCHDVFIDKAIENNMGYQFTTGRPRLNNSRFVEKSKSKHGEKYDYRFSNYTYSHKLIEINCPIHGVFWQKAYRHLNGHGCKKCGIISTIEKRSKLRD